MVADVGLPDRKGDVLAGELRALHPELPIIIATGYDSPRSPAVSRQIRRWRSFESLTPKPI